MALHKLREEFRKAIKEMGFEESTLIQEKTIPLIQQGKDVIGQAKTGSGKTAAFSLPVLEKLEPGKPAQALILTPTRELCVQIADEIKKFAKYTSFRATSVYGGVPLEPQIRAMRSSEIIVGTPGRILDHLRRRNVSFSGTRFVIIDEADRMFEMGFIDDVEAIISHTPKERQTLLFSATMPEKIRKLADKHMKDPVRVSGERMVDPSKLRQVYYNIRPHEKFSLLVHLLNEKSDGLSLVFCGSRREVDSVAKNLQMQGVNAMAIHGGMDQKKRLRSLDKLKKEHIRVLVATDVAARGLDIKNVRYVYNYSVPRTGEDYIHRVGRTARAGENGEAITLLVERDYTNFDRVLRDSATKILRMEPPEFRRVRFARDDAPREREYRREAPRKIIFGSRGGRRPFRRR